MSTNIQFNVKSGKNFREVMARYNDAMHGLNDYICSKSDRVKSLNTLIATNKSDLEKIANGESGVLRDADIISAEINDFMAKLEEESKALSNARKECAKRLEEAEKLVGEALYNSAMTDDFNNQFALFLNANGFSDACADNVPTLHFGIKKSSAKKSFNDGTLTSKLAFKPWRTLFLCTLCDTLVENKAISPYKYNYVKPVKNK